MKFSSILTVLASTVYGYAAIVFGLLAVVAITVSQPFGVLFCAALAFGCARRAYQEVTHR